MIKSSGFKNYRRKSRKGHTGGFRGGTTLYNNSSWIDETDGYIFGAENPFFYRGEYRRGRSRNVRYGGRKRFY
jgi:hypothetical protein